MVRIPPGLPNDDEAGWKSMSGLVVQMDVLAAVKLRVQAPSRSRGQTLQHAVHEASTILQAHFHLQFNNCKCNQFCELCDPDLARSELQEESTPCSSHEGLVSRTELSQFLDFSLCTDYKVFVFEELRDLFVWPCQLSYPLVRRRS
ncbi:unnamed protein product [Protopolystoma xenopodis]|uniref:Uncharacterized protein n=1 Tax=Protopolystoma xenopodis TaxID=117903 RepID=A0A448XK87_9PLAT|nr:unnamed protein product [Protopolystoma xenopodis]